MNEAMKQAWLEISRMLGEPTREELDVFLRTWQRATEAHKQVKPDFWEGYVPEPVKPAQQEFVLPGGGYVPAIPAQQRPIKTFHGGKAWPVQKPAQQQEPVALFEWLPEGATHIGRISVRTEAGGSLAMRTHAFKYDSAVLKVYVTDNDNEYPGWRAAKDCFFHLNFPVLPLYTSPPAQRTWVGLSEEEMQALWDRYAHMEMMRAIEAKLKEKNT